MDRSFQGRSMSGKRVFNDGSSGIREMHLHDSAICFPRLAGNPTTLHRSIDGCGDGAARQKNTPSDLIYRLGSLVEQNFQQCKVRQRAKPEAGNTAVIVLLECFECLP